MAFFDGIMDTIHYHWDRCLFAKLPDGKLKTWLKSDWKNKYIDRDPKKGKKKIFNFLPIPDAISDGWHGAKSLMILCILLSLGLFIPWYWVLICWGLWVIGFYVAFAGLVKKW